MEISLKKSTLCIASLRSWRYCVIKVLAAEPRSKKKEWGRGVWNTYFWRLRRQLSLDLYSGSAAKSPSPSTQYRQYFKRLVPTPFFLDRGSAAKTLITQYRQLRRLPCVQPLHLLNKINLFEGRGDYVYTGPDSSFCTDTKTKQDRASVHTWERWFRLDFCNGAKLPRRSDL